MKLLTLFVLSACNAAAPDRPLDPPKRTYEAQPSTSYVRADPNSMCLAVGAECGADATMACCEGSFCKAELFVYGPNTCAAPQADGSYCQEDRHCAGGHCVGSICHSGSCGAETQGCDDAYPCCAGFVCELWGYTEGVCVPPFENGRFCQDNAQCASGACINNTCADPSCRSEGAECYDDMTSCCPGLYCFQDPGAYGLALCAQPQGTGAFCLENAACASGSCVDNVCL